MEEILNDYNSISSIVDSKQNIDLGSINIRVDFFSSVPMKMLVALNILTRSRYSVLIIVYQSCSYILFRVGFKDFSRA